MLLTPDELKMLAWLRRQNAAWPTNRAIILLSSIISLGGAIWEYWHFGWSALPLVLLLLGTYGLSHTLGCWSGRPEVSLLLKLVEASQDHPGA